MRSFLREDPLTFGEAAALIPGRPHKNTLRRWATTGYKGVKLRCFRSGNALCTSRAAIEDFWAAINPQYEEAEAPSSSAHADAENKLDALGV